MAVAAAADLFAFQEPPTYSTLHSHGTPIHTPNDAEHTHTSDPLPDHTYKTQHYMQLLHKHAARANYKVFATKHTITLIHTHTLLPYLSHAHTPLHDGRLHTFLFVPPSSPPFSITNTYFYQQGFHDPKQPPLLIQAFKAQCSTTKSRYPTCSCIILGDINASTTNQTSLPQARNFLHFAQNTLGLHSTLADHCKAINEQYITRQANATRLVTTSPDHILLPPDLADKATNHYIDRAMDITTIHSDHFLLLTDIPLAPPLPSNTTSIPQPTTPNSSTCL